MGNIKQFQRKQQTSSLRSWIVSLASVILGLWGILIALITLWFGFVFVSAHMLYPANALFLGMATIQCILVLFLAFRLKKQKWFISLGMLVALVTVMCINSVLVNPIYGTTERIKTMGISMEPTLKPGDYLIVDNLAYHSALPQRGDLVKFTGPGGSQYIKRAIGLPGETVKIEAGQVYINNIPLLEPGYISKASYSGIWQLVENEYFMLGDNRNNSADSRLWGPILMENIQGRAAYRYLPVSRAGRIANDYQAP